ncbi:hypothetical protein ACFL0O_11150 [Thermodesulfobacteriota bacterium]
MAVFQTFNTTLTDKDLDFLVRTVSPGSKDRYRLKQVIAQDRDFRSTFVGDEKVFRQVVDDDEILLKISPNLKKKKESG